MPVGSGSGFLNSDLLDPDPEQDPGRKWTGSANLSQKRQKITSGTGKLNFNNENLLTNLNGQKENLADKANSIPIGNRRID